MEPNEGPNWTQTAPWNSQHGIWMNLNKSSQSDLQHWRVIWSLTLNPSGFEGAVLANTMFVTFGRPYFSLRIVLTFKKKLFRFQVCGGKELKPKHLQEVGRDLFFDMCWVPCSSHNLPKQAATGRKPDVHGAQLHRGKPQRGNNGGNTTGRPHRENEKCHVYGG